MAIPSILGFSPKNGSQIMANHNQPPPKTTLTYKTRVLYIGKVENKATTIEITSDRIVFQNISNGIQKSRFKITIPFIEINCLRHCFVSDISIIAIQPIFASFEKLSQWIKNESVTRFVPENFIMIEFDNFNAISQDEMAWLRNKAKLINNEIHIMEINSLYARNYLNYPNKDRLIRPRNSISTHGPQEVIHLVSDDDEDEFENSAPENGEVNLLNKIILRYPEISESGSAIILYGSDLTCLENGSYLNDNIMNFYLKFYQHSESNLDQKILAQIHIMDALFATHLLNHINRKRKYHGSIPANTIAFYREEFQNTYDKLLKKWTKDIDIFSKDFIIIPLIKDSHWFLAILCYIKNLIPPEANNGDKENSNCRPTIIYMDSLGQGGREEITRIIKLYLSCEFAEKRGNATKKLAVSKLAEIYANVPLQNNYFDCGLFALEYIERFLSDPHKHYRDIVSNSQVFQKWFKADSLSVKRYRIKHIILNLMPEQDVATLRKQLEDYAEQQQQQALEEEMQSNKVQQGQWTPPRSQQQNSEL